MKRQRVKRKLTISKELTPLQQKLTKLADLISKVGYIAAVLIFLALFIRGLISRRDPLARDTDADTVLTVFSALLGYFVLHGHHHRRRGAGRAADERDRVAGPGHAEDDASQQPGPAAGRLRDDRLGHGHLLRQDRHADAKQDAGGAPSWDGQAFDRGTPDWAQPDADAAVAARRQAARLDRPQRRRQLDREPGGKARQADRRRQLDRGRAAAMAARGRG